MAQDLFGYDEVESVGQVQEEQSKKKTATPIYEPKKVQPSLFACYDQQKYQRLLRLIDRSTVNDEEKEFLRLAATRFVEFNYETIADYYVCASKEMQGLMEKLALVIIDFDRAIEDGFITLNKKMRELYEQELEAARHE